MFTTSNAHKVLDLAAGLGIEMPETRLALDISETAAIGTNDPGDLIRELARKAVRDANSPEAVSANLVAAAGEASMLLASAELVRAAKTSIRARLEKAGRAETKATLTAAADIATKAMDDLTKVIGKLPTDWRTNPDTIVDRKLAPEFTKAREATSTIEAVYALADELLAETFDPDVFLLFDGPDHDGHLELVKSVASKERVSDVVERYARGQSALTFTVATTRDEFKRRDEDAYQTRTRELAKQAEGAKTGKQAGGPRRTPVAYF